MRTLFLSLILVCACSAPNFKSQNVVGDEANKSNLPGGDVAPPSGADAAPQAAPQKPSVSPSKIEPDPKQCSQGGLKIVTCAEDATCSPNSLGYKELTVCNEAQGEGLATPIAANCPASGPSISTCTDSAEPKGVCTSSDTGYKVTELAPCSTLKTANLPAGGTNEGSARSASLPSGAPVNLGCTADDDEFVNGGSVGLTQSGLEEFRASFQCKAPSVVSGVLANGGGFECCRASAQPTLIRANDRSVNFPLASTMDVTLAQEAICPSTHPFLYGVELRSYVPQKSFIYGGQASVSPLNGNGAVIVAGMQGGFTNPAFKCASLLIGNQALKPSGARSDILFARGNIVIVAAPLQLKCPAGQVAIGFKIGAAVFETGYFHNNYLVCSAVSVQ